MNNNRLYSGIVLICIGLAILLNLLGWVHFNWGNFIYLWPLFLVIGGVNLLLSNNRAPWATIVRLAVVIGCFAVILFGNFNFSHRWGAWHFNRHRDNVMNLDDDDDDRPIKGSTSTYSQPWNNKIKTAELNISGGVTSYKLSDTTADLMAAQALEVNGRYVFDHTVKDSTAEISLHKKRTTINFGTGGDDKVNKTEIKLNAKPVWDIDIKGGADELNFDLSRFKVRSLKLSGGATDYDVKMGMPQTATRVNISAGVSDITINVPAGAACQVITSTGLSDTNIDGFNKINSNRYETANFASAEKKLYIHFSGGISDFNVKRY